MAVVGQVRPPRRHVNHVERVFGVLDWKGFFDALGLQVHGHTRTAHMRQRGVDAVHCFRFVRSEDLGRPGGWTWPDGPTCASEHPRDVLLLAKMHMASQELTETLLFCRNDSFLRLGATPQPVPLVATDPATAKEYEKTAAAVEQAPWRLERAASYLRTLAAEPPAPVPLSVDWLWSPPTPRPQWAATVTEDDVRGIGEDKAPGPLTVHDRLAKRRRTTECPGDNRVAAPAVNGVAAPAVGAALAVKAKAPPPLVAKAKPVAQVPVAKAPPAKAAPKHGPQPPRARPRAPLCPGLGCPKCRHSAFGCRQCKASLGWHQTAAGHWEHRVG